MKIHLVNPNTTASMTQQALVAANKVRASTTKIIATQPDYGPVSIEGYYDEVFSIPGMLELIAANNDCDAHVIACFDDTGLDAARCLADAPVVGICEAACLNAVLLANSFSIVTTLSRSVPALQHLTTRYGMKERCVSVRASDIAVLDLENETKEATDVLHREIEIALVKDGAEAIVLGCAGMTDMAESVSQKFGVPVIDGVSAAIKLAEGLVSQQLQTSRVRGYAKPINKPYSGKFSCYKP